jgi:hypothetical protein
MQMLLLICQRNDARDMVSHSVASMQTSLCATMQWVQRQRASRTLSASASLTTLLQVRVLLRTCAQQLHDSPVCWPVSKDVCGQDVPVLTLCAGNQDPDPPVPAPGGSGTPWWVWLLVGVAALVILALATLLLLKCLRRRRKRQAARQLVMAPPAHKVRTCAQPHTCRWSMALACAFAPFDCLHGSAISCTNGCA